MRDKKLNFILSFLLIGSISYFALPTLALSSSGVTLAQVKTFKVDTDLKSTEIVKTPGIEQYDDPRKAAELRGSLREAVRNGPQQQPSPSTKPRSQYEGTLREAVRSGQLPPKQISKPPGEYRDEAIGSGLPKQTIGQHGEYVGEHRTSH